MKLTAFLTQNSYWIINKELAKQIGRDETFLLTDLITKYEYFKNNNMTVSYDDIEYFFATSESIENDTMFSYYEQKKLLKRLENLGLIKIVKKGIPAKLYFHIVENNILSYFNSSIQETSKLDFEKLENIIIDNNNNKTNNNSNNVYMDPKPKKVKFTIPTISEIENYIKENNYDVDATKFFNFYESKDWFVGKNKMANWKAAVRTWVTNNQNNSKGLANGNNKANNSGVQIRSTSDIKRTITTEQIEDGIRNLYENGF